MARTRGTRFVKDTHLQGTLVEGQEGQGRPEAAELLVLVAEELGGTGAERAGGDDNMGASGQERVENRLADGARATPGHQHRLGGGGGED